MSCGEVKPGRRTSKSWALRQLKVGFAGGVLVVLVTYLVVTQRFAISAPYVVITEARRITDKQTIKVPPETTEKEAKVVCSAEGRFSKTCEVDGDVRTNGTAQSVVVVAASSSERREWKAWPYSRRGIGSTKEITVTQLPDPAAAPPCTVTYTMPAVLFALGGHSGNYWHDYTDVLIPLFVASRRYDGEVQFLVASMEERPKWLARYRALVRRLSRYDAVDLDGDAAVRCFPHVTVGIRIDKEFSVVPELVPGPRRLAMTDFTAFLREAYALPRHAPVNPAREPGRKPRLLLIHRGHYRRLLNEAEILRSAEAVGFEAAAVELRDDTPEGEQARAVNSFDVLLGMHGAGLTNAVFLPPGAVVIQVVPYGKMDFVSRAEFLEPVTDMGLRYFDYTVTAEESSLLELLGPEHPAIKDPLSVHRSGWLEVYEIYLRKQDVRINVTRFAPMLWQALDHLRQQQQ